MANLAKIRELLNNIAQEHNYQNHRLDIAPITTQGASFTTFLYTATITSEDKDDLNLFVKYAAMGAKIRENITLNIYKIEHFVYTKLRKTYRDLEERYGVPEKNRFHFSEYYGGITMPLEETLVLENLAAKGFVSHDRFKAIDWQYASTAVNELAKFHALSIAYQRDYPEGFQQFSDIYDADWINENSVASIWKPSFETAAAAVSGDDKVKLKRFLDGIGVEEIKNLYKPLRCEVLTHVDFRPSNLMHRKNEGGSFEIRVLDFQTLKLSCPVLDLLYLIFTGTDKTFRDEHYQQLIDHYYIQLAEAMNHLRIDPKTYSREDYDLELNEKLPFGLIIAAFTLLIVTQDFAELPEVGDNEDLGNFAMTKASSLYTERINGVVQDYKAWGILAD